MSPSLPTFENMRSWRYWRNLIVNAIIFVIVGIAIIIAIAVVGEPYFNNPPVQIARVGDENLGTFCPGDVHTIHNIVTIQDQVVALYYISVMDERAIFNIPGTQTILSGYQHPVPATFHQYIEWSVPPLQPGRYTLAFAARGTDTEEKTVFITSTLTTKENCP